MIELITSIDPALFSPARALDIGAGSGIASFAIAQHFSCPVIATDIAKSAVDICAENARANGLAEMLTCLQADGFAHPRIADGAPYDLIVMNILADVLLRLAADAQAHLASGGVLVTSGVLVWQEAQIREAFEALGLELTGRVLLGDWVSQLWQKPE